ncbi:helix-turn-helix transcriptional regulator [Luteimonas sp. SJ-92]|uniref:Helix-turn-helix transcriptional regulator n=1 Tax=Luteimonas salinisoli TaxID=2752307 RepID=A0A853JGY7_9GAMM|nr:helix-turn-helix transcriptional regulator [Luteimonas salinisoli]NZA28656.1 helix-turn-helix transcriptional regulator [Luteimonas salinisoli]
MPAFTHRPEYRALIGALREARLKAGLTQIDVAEALKTTQTFVSKVERGERRIDVIEFADFCHAIGIDPGALLHEVIGARPRARSRSRDPVS